MTTDTEEKINKNKILRHNEYYDMQDILDNLYAESKNNRQFKNLIDLILDERNILLAYRNIKKNKGSNTPGVNGRTIESINKWETDKIVKYVRNRINNFQPMKVKFKEIPKPNGGVRPLGIPTIEDRIIQQCIKQILEPICEAKFFHHSYGFRPNRSTSHAIARNNMLINNTKLHYVVDVDIKGFFDNVNHGKLLKQMWSLGIKDKNLLSVISKMLKAEIDGKGRPTKGTPQGGILSPLLSNIVLNEFDWWISDQWETFETRKNYDRYIRGLLSRGHKYRALRNTKLKEIYLVRYADDFKIFCRDYKTSQKIFDATIKWLDERLGLEVNKDKSNVINLRKNSSNFLGFEIRVREKGKRYVVKSKVSRKAKDKIKKELKRKIKYINKNANADTVNMYNATILGQHNYYSIATHVAKDFYRIGFDLKRTLYNNTKSKATNKGTKNKAYEKFYKKYNYKTMYISGIALYPIQGIDYKNALAFTQETCNYTPRGRRLIHDKLKSIDMNVLRYIMRYPISNESEQYNDNRISLYCGQQGKCYITKETLEIGDMEVHHKKMKCQGGTDEYNNLVYLKKDIHRLIHSKEEKVIEKYLNKLNLTDKGIEKINNLRELVGNCLI